MTFKKRACAVLAAGALAAGVSGLAVVAAPSATAAGCDSWSSTLRKGSTGAGVKELQIRVAGYAPYGTVMAADGVYGDQTVKAVTAFQRAYGLKYDGVAGSQTFAKLRALSKSDCTPLHFTYAEASNNCGKGFNGTATQKANLRRSLWQAEALRHRMGDKPLKVTSGFRSGSCEGGKGQHNLGTALDLVPIAGTGHTLCSIAKAAQSNGYGGIFGPGYPDHSDHIHVDWRSSVYWDARNCGVRKGW